LNAAVQHRNWTREEVLKPLLLIAETVLIPAIGALPGNAVAGHAPQVLMHAILADVEAAATAPAEQELPAAARALAGGFGAPSPSARGVGGHTIHCLSCGMKISMLIKTKAFSGRRLIAQKD
jgi:hypothetical protein